MSTVFGGPRSRPPGWREGVGLSSLDAAWRYSLPRGVPRAVLWLGQQCLIPSHLPACADGRQACLCRGQTGASGRPERTARRRGTRCRFLCNGSSRIAPQRDPTHPNGLGRRGLPRVAPRQPPWPVHPRCHRCPQRFFGLTALPRLWQACLVLGQCPGCPACGRRRPARPKSKFLSLTHSASITSIPRPL